MKKIILVAGKAGVGKDTFSNILAEELRLRGDRVGRDAFARNLKGMVQNYFNWDGVNKTKEIRTLLQNLGTEVAKIELNYKNYHSRRMAEDIDVLKDYFDYFIISDVRFKEECYYMLSSFPGDVIIVNVEGRKYDSELSNEQQQHKSEVDLIDYRFDHTILNDGSLDGLRKRSKMFIEDYLK